MSTTSGIAKSINAAVRDGTLGSGNLSYPIKAPVSPIQESIDRLNSEISFLGEVISSLENRLSLSYHPPNRGDRQGSGLLPCSFSFSDQL